MKDLPITEARDELTLLPDRLSETHETITVTRRGKPVLAILSWDEYEALVETLEIISDEELMQSLRQGMKDLAQGKTVPWERAKLKLFLWLSLSYKAFFLKFSLTSTAGMLFFPLYRIDLCYLSADRLKFMRFL